MLNSGEMAVCVCGTCHTELTGTGSNVEYARAGLADKEVGRGSGYRYWCPVFFRHLPEITGIDDIEILVADLDAMTEQFKDHSR